MVQQLLSLLFCGISLVSNAQKLTEKDFIRYSWICVNGSTSDQHILSKDTIKLLKYQDLTDEETITLPDSFDISDKWKFFFNEDSHFFEVNSINFKNASHRINLFLSDSLYRILVLDTLQTSEIFTKITSDYQWIFDGQYITVYRDEIGQDPLQFQFTNQKWIRINTTKGIHVSYLSGLENASWLLDKKHQEINILIPGNGCFSSCFSYSVQRISTNEFWLISKSTLQLR